MAEQAVAASPEPRREARLPWSQRLHDAHPVAPWKVGVGLFALLCLAFFGLEVALGRQALAAAAPAELEPYRNLRLALLMFLVIGYLVAGSLHQVRTSRRTLRALAPSLGLDGPEAARLADEPGRTTGRALGRAALLALGFSLGLPLLVDPWRVVYDPRVWSLEMFGHRLLLPVVCWWAVRLIGLVLAQSRRLNALAGRLPGVDLFELASLEPFTRQGLRHVLEVLGLLACILLLLTEERFGGLVVAVSALGLATAAAGLLLPLRGVRARILEAKGEALAACRARLREATDALRRGEGAAGRVADLTAWEARIEAVREWPIGGLAVSQMLLYLLIPLGSWLGGALVERAVDAALR